MTTQEQFEGRTPDSEAFRNASRKKTDRVMNKLTTKNLILLSELVRAEYAERKQSDNDFAVYAAEKLGTRITGGNIQGMRETFGIPSSREVAALQNPDMLVKRVEELERVVAHIKHNLGL
jgi:aconitase A